MWKRIKSLFSINSIPRRMRVAFMSIALLLISAGATSLLELERVGQDTQQILENSQQNVDVAREMATALSNQNDAIIYMAVVGDSSSRYRVECENAIASLKSSSDEAYRIMENTEYHNLGDSLRMHAYNLNELARNYLDGKIQQRIDAQNSIDTLHHKLSSRTWYVDEYKIEHMNLSKQISKYMTGSQSTLGPEVSSLSHTARRAVTPVFISLLVMLIVVMILYFFLMRLYVNPMMRMNRSLGDYLTYKVPFDSAIECHDEIKEFRDKIASLISKNNK